MKIKLIMLSLATSLMFAACNGKQADQENADSMNQYSDSSTVDTMNMDSSKAIGTADSTTNAPADVKN